MSDYVTLLFEPLDVLHFRDHRPFDLGSHAVAKTIFPGPSTFRGALRTLLFSRFGAQFDNQKDDHFGLQDEHAWARPWLGGPRRIGALVIRGPLLARRTRDTDVAPLFHPPHDVTALKPAERKSDPCKGNLHCIFDPRDPATLDASLTPRRLRWRGVGSGESDGPLPWVEGDPEKPDDEGVFWTEAGARKYFEVSALRGFKTLMLPGKESADGLLVVRARWLFEKEDRVGIARNGSTMAAEDGMFYITSPYRMKRGVGFAIDVQLPDVDAERAKDALKELQGAVTSLGGKGHCARVSVFEQALVHEDLVATPSTVGRKLWLQTAHPLSGPLPNGALVVGERATPIGGFDFALRAPRALRPAIPAGSVIHLPAGATLPIADKKDTPTGHGFALAGPIPSKDESR